MKEIVFHVACLVLFIVPLIFIAHNVYKDGVLGRLSLSGIVIASFLFLLDWLDDDASMIDPDPLFVWQTVTFAAFLVWHLWRFHRRVLKKKEVYYPPECPKDRRRCPDRRFTPN